MIINKITLKNIFGHHNKMEKGICKFCNSTEEEILLDLFGVKVCEGCYHDILNHMKYKNFNDLLDCDKQQLMLFLNELAKIKVE